MSTRPMTQERLDAIRERVGGITDGPWSYWSGRDYRENCVKSDSREDAPTVAEVIPEADDAVFIAHAPQDITDLLADNEQLRADNERLRARLTVDDAMVERAARESYGPQRWDRILSEWPILAPVKLSAHRAMTRAVLNAALNPGEGS